MGSAELDEAERSWFCEHCFATKSPVQVTYQERCTLCNNPVKWCRWNEETQTWEPVDE